MKVGVFVVIKKFTLGEYQSNCYVISYENEAIIIDPGYENDVIIPYLEKAKLTPKYVFLTHGHFDHIGGVNQLKKHFNNVEVLIHELDVIWLKENEYNLTGTTVLYNTVITEEKSIFLNDLEFNIIFTPGHSAGGMSLVTNNHLFSGDTIFQMSIGRYDFPFANYDDLVASIKKIYQFPDEMIIHPGHGDNTSVGFEKKYNYFVKG